MLARFSCIFLLPLAHFPKSLRSLTEGECGRAVDVSLSQKKRWKQGALVAYVSQNWLKRNHSLVFAVRGGEKNASRRKKSKHMETSAAKRHWRNGFVFMWEVHQPPEQHLCTLNDPRVSVAIPHLGTHGVTLWNTWMSGEALSLGQKLPGCQSTASRGRPGWSNIGPTKLWPCLAATICFILFIPSYSFLIFTSGSAMHHKPAPLKRRELWVLRAQERFDFFV